MNMDFKAEKISAKDSLPKRLDEGRFFYFGERKSGAKCRAVLDLSFAFKVASIVLCPLECAGVSYPDFFPLKHLFRIWKKWDLSIECGGLEMGPTYHQDVLGGN